MAANNGHHEHHLMSFKTHMNVFWALIVLTVITVWAAQFDFGVLGPVVAFGIATAKALLVMGWFMHLKYDGMINRLIMASGFFFLALLFVISVFDIYTRINPRL